MKYIVLRISLSDVTKLDFSRFHIISKFICRVKTCRGITTIRTIKITPTTWLKLDYLLDYAYI